ncbi:MAG: patatin-like phospholipase family protein [Treponema sp.]|nr:patatin-like phospholipase family protein [Treponema sp.]
MNLKRILYSLIICFGLSCVYSQEYGLVLSGGGGKGAYEVGVWKALKEYGIADRVTVISGTSVGGLNAGLFACEAYDTIEYIWKYIVPKKLQTEDSLISQDGLREIFKIIHLNKIRENKYPQVMVTAVRNRFKTVKAITGKTGSYAHRFLLNDETDVEEMKNLLLATSAFPVICSPVLLKDGHKYIDGGGNFMGGDNIPWSPVLERYPEIKNLIVVYLDNNPKHRIKKISHDDRTVLEIIPTIAMTEHFLEGTVNFSQMRISLLIQQGYEDTVNALKMLKIKGKKLYPVSSYWFE